MTIEITNPVTEALIQERLQSGEFKDPEAVILQALQESPARARRYTQAERAAAIEDLMTFGKRHGISLGGLTMISCSVRSESKTRLARNGHE
jgi:hypothetical protein